MSRYIVSDVDIALDRRYYWLWDTETGPVAKGMRKGDFIPWLLENYGSEFSERRIKNAETFGCSSVAYTLDELIAKFGLSYDDFWKEWT